MKDPQDYVVELKNADQTCTRCWTGERYKALPAGHTQYRVSGCTREAAIARAQRIATPKKVTTLNA